MLKLTFIIGALVSTCIAQQYSGQQQFSEHTQNRNQESYNDQQEYKVQLHLSTTPVALINRDYSINPNSNLYFNFQQRRSDQPPQIEDRVESLGKYLYVRPKTTTPPTIPPVHFSTSSHFGKPQHTEIVHSTEKSHFVEPQHSEIVHSTERYVQPVHIPSAPQLSNINEADILAEVTGRNNWNGNNYLHYNPVHHQTAKVRNNFQKQNMLKRRLRPLKFIGVTKPPALDVTEEQYFNDEEQSIDHSETKLTSLSSKLSSKYLVQTTSLPESEVEELKSSIKQNEFAVPSTTPRPIHKNIRINNKHKSRLNQSPAVTTTAFPRSKEVTEEVIFSQVPESSSWAKEHSHGPHLRGAGNRRTTEKYHELPISPRGPPPPVPTLTPWHGDNFGK